MPYSALSITKRDIDVLKKNSCSDSFIAFLQQNELISLVAQIILTFDEIDGVFVS